MNIAENIKEYFVIDVSFVLAYLLKENQKVEEVVKKFIEGEIEFLSTTFLKYEIGNGLRSAVLRKRIIGSKLLTLNTKMEI